MTTTSLSVGLHAITAVYGGDSSNFASSTSTAIVETIRTWTTTTVTSSGSSVVGASRHLHGGGYRRRTDNPATAATGTVTFADNGVSIGTGAVVSGDTASYTTSTLQLAAGTDPITAVYGGDANYGMSTSAAFSQAVSQATTSITLAQPPTSVYGQSVTFTATVTNTVTSTGAGWYGDLRGRRQLHWHRSSQWQQHEQHSHDDCTGFGDRRGWPVHAHGGCTTATASTLRRQHPLKPGDAGCRPGEYDDDGGLVHGHRHFGVWPDRDLHGDSDCGQSARVRRPAR